MKLSNFRIKDRIHIKKQRTDNPSNEQERHFSEEISSKNDSMNFSSFLQTFEKCMSFFANRDFNQTTRSSHSRNKNTIRFDQVDFRDRFVLIDLPDLKDRQFDYKKLENWLGELSSEILSVSFHYLAQRKMDYNQMKAFASECFLRNIVILADNCKLTNQAMEFIDKRLKEKIFPYLITKYPLTSQKQVNKNLQAKVKSIDHSEVLQNDYLFSSEVIFEYRKDGQYDDLIMRMLNEIMKRCDGKKQEGQNSNFEQFEKLMTQIFEKPFKPEGVDSDITKKNYQKNIDDKIIGQDQLEENRQHEKYKQKVKEYTEYLIGRKISQNVPPYTEEEIQRRSIKIKSPAVLRILTKWCQELWAKFENENYFWQRKEKLSISGTKEKCMIEESVKRNLTDQVKKEKAKLQEMKQKLSKINYAQQLKLLQNELSREENIYIDREERISGLVACKVVNNLESFIIDYLNSLIHGLLRVAKDSHNQMDVFQKLIIPVPLSLLSFKISDILRCKYASKEREVLRVFRQIHKISNENPDRFKIIRIKNRLKLSTNDIVINARLNNQINCEIQIAVNNAQSNFMSCSNKINHYIYQLQRAQFGPILQMCSIWRTCEKRSITFIKMIEQQHPKKRRQNVQEKSEQISRNMIPCNHPFVCSQCNLHFYQNNFIVSHQYEQDTNYWKCAQCLISQNIAAQNVGFFLEQEQKFINEITNIKLIRNNVVPENGAFISINKPTIQVFLFKKITHKFKDLIIVLKDQKLSIMKTINSNKITEKQKFFEECVIFELPSQMVDAHFNRNKQQIEEEVVTQIILKNQLNSCFKESRQQLSILSEKHLSKLDIQKIINQFEQSQAKKLKIKSIEFSDSNLPNLDLVLTDFSALNRLILNKNKIKDISRLCEFKDIQKVDFCENQIMEIPNQIGNLKKLKELRIRQNSVEILPEGLFELKFLEIMDVSYNKIIKIPDNFQKLENLKMVRLAGNSFGQIPSFIFNMSHIKSMNLAGCNISQVSEDIGKLVGLQVLSLKSNKLKNLPDKFFNMVNLTQLYLNDNQFQSVPERLGDLKNLRILYLCDNRILKSVPQRLGDLINLNQLDLSNNQLKNLPESLGNLKNLSVLYLEHNKLTALPQRICDLKNLIQLELCSNNLTSLPEKIGNLKNLYQLNLSDNQLISIPQKMGDLKNLYQLNLSDNQLISIPQKMGDLKNLYQLNLIYNRLTSLPDSMANLKSLTELDLNNNKFQTIPLWICNHALIRTLDIQNNKIEKIPAQISGMKSLGDGRLLLSGNPLKEVGDQDFVLKKSPNWRIISERLKNEQEAKLKQTTTENVSN